VDSKKIILNYQLCILSSFQVALKFPSSFLVYFIYFSSMNKKVLSFLVPFLMLGFIATLFPPTYGHSTFNGFSFLFSSSLHSIIWDKLILEYLFISFLSGLISITYWKLGGLFISYFSISLILSIIFYFLFGFASYIFYPSYIPIVTKEKPDGKFQILI